MDQSRTVQAHICRTQGETGFSLRYGEFLRESEQSIRKWSMFRSSVQRKGKPTVTYWYLIFPDIAYI